MSQLQQNHDNAPKRPKISKSTSSDTNINTECIKKSKQFRNGSQTREAASSMKFFVDIDCLGPCDVEKTKLF